jgi:hypothetical protein
LCTQATPDPALLLLPNCNPLGSGAWRGGYSF